MFTPRLAKVHYCFQLKGVLKFTVLALFETANTLVSSRVGTSKFKDSRLGNHTFLFRDSSATRTRSLVKTISLVETQTMMMILRGGGHIPTNSNRTHQRHSSYQPERSCGEEICIYIPCTSNVRAAMLDFSRGRLGGATSP